MVKKSFKNPALNFISEETKKGVDGEEKKEKIMDPVVPEGYKISPEFIELKSKRVQLLVQPSTIDAVKKIAKKNKVSVNEMINIILKEYIK